jgi:hypothetical protein
LPSWKPMKTRWDLKARKTKGRHVALLGVEWLLSGCGYWRWTVLLTETNVVTLVYPLGLGVVPIIDPFLERGL